MSRRGLVPKGGVAARRPRRASRGPLRGGTRGCISDAALRCRRLRRRRRPNGASTRAARAGASRRRGGGRRFRAYTSPSARASLRDARPLRYLFHRARHPRRCRRSAIRRADSLPRVRVGSNGRDRRTRRGHQDDRDQEKRESAGGLGSEASGRPDRHDDLLGKRGRTPTPQPSYRFSQVRARGRRVSRGGGVALDRGHRSVRSRTVGCGTPSCPRKMEDPPVRNGVAPWKSSRSRESLPCRGDSPS